MLDREWERERKRETESEKLKESGRQKEGERPKGLECKIRVKFTVMYYISI